MPIVKSIRDDRQPGRQVVEVVLREAKKLHRAAVSESLAASLPVLRRVLSAHVIRGMTLPELSRHRGMVQRKHVLRMLAVEAGYPGWEEYRGALVATEPQSLQQFDVMRHVAGYPNIWFSSMKEAEEHSAVHGGRAVRVGQQAVVFVELQPVGQEPTHLHR